MRTYEYKGFDSTGRALKGLIEALDLKDARERLSSRGVMAETVQATHEQQPSVLRRPWRESFGLDVRAMLYRELGALLGSGLPLAQALDVLIAAPELGEHRGRVAAARDRLREGSTLAAALHSMSDAVSAYEVAIIEAGERTGALDAVLDRLASFLEEQIRLRDKIQSSLIYPAIVFSLSFVIGLFMMGLMIPRIGRLLAEASIPLPVITRVMIALGKGLLPCVALGVVVIPILVLAFRRAMRNNPATKAAWSAFLFRIPFWRRPYTALVNLRFARTLTLLMEGGVPLVEGLAMAARATGNSWIVGLGTQAAETIRHGHSVADAIRSIPPLGDSLPLWIQAGEASGKLEKLLQNAGDRFQQQWERQISRAVAVVEPVLILAVGSFVLLVALSVLLPILSLNQMIR